MNASNHTQLRRLVLPVPTSTHAHRHRLIDARCLSRRVRPLRSIIFTMHLHLPNVTVRPAASRANGNRCLPSNPPPSRRTIRSVSVIATTRRIPRRIKPPLRQASNLRRPPLRPFLRTPVPRTRRTVIPRVPASPKSRNDCAWNLNIPNCHLCFARIYQPSSYVCSLATCTYSPFTIPVEVV